MALDPNIILRAGNWKPIDPGQLLETRAQLQMRNAAAAKAQRDEQMAQAKTVRLGQVGTIAATGDYAGATRAALQAGDFDLAKHVGEMDDRSKAMLAAKVGVAAPVFATALTEADPAKRTQIIAAALPTLKANGYTDDEIAKINPTDEFLRGAVANAQSIGDIIKHQEFLMTEAGKTEDRTIRREDQRLDRDNARGNAYIAAGLLPPDAPGGGGALGGAGGGSGGTTAGRTQYGWTPRSRNGGDNADAAVDGKISGMAKALGVDPDAPITSLSPMQIAQALTLSEGGKGSLADRNNNPGNLINPKTGGYQKFPTKEAGLQAAAAQVRRNLARGQTTIRTMVEGLPVAGARGGGLAGGGLAIIPGGKLDPKADKAPSGYRFTPSGDLEPIPGGPGDKQGRQANLKPPPVAATKAYIDNRSSIRKIAEAFRAVVAYPDAVGLDKGILPNFVTSRSDPKGVDARGKISDVGSLLIHDRSGAAVTISETPRLKPFVPEVGDTPAAVKTKLRNLRSALEETNTDIADAYSEDQGYKFPQFRGGTLRTAPTAGRSAGPAPVRVTSVEQARALAPGTQFITPDGRRKVR